MFIPIEMRWCQFCPTSSKYPNVELEKAFGNIHGDI